MIFKISYYIYTGKNCTEPLPIKSSSLNLADKWSIFSDDQTTRIDGVWLAVKLF